MKKLYLKTLLVFVSLLPMYVAAANTEDPVIKEEKLTDIKAYITFSEYFIRWQSTADAYQSPNRRNNLVATYSGQDVTIAAGGSHPEWTFSLNVDNVTADGKQICKPVKNPLMFLHDNVIQFNHDGKFTVEYVNNEEGVRQNFIIEQPASQPQKVSVQLYASEGWKTEKQSSSSLSFTHGDQKLNYNGLKVWDAKGTRLKAHFVVINNLVQIEVETCDAVYPITIDPLVANSTPQNASLFLQSNVIHGNMGISVAGAGDINNDGFDDIIVGVPRYTSGQTEEGAAFIYYGSSLGINPGTFTLLEGNADSVELGYTVVGGGHVNYDSFADVIIGSPYVRVPGLAGFAGKFYVYKGSATGIVTTPDATIEGSANYAFAGDILSSAGDVNGDGYDDVLAGEWGTRNGYNTYGVVWVYYGGPFGIQYTVPTMLQAAIASGYTFGTRVSDAGDVNGDGYDDILIGSTGGISVDYKGTVRIYYGNAENGIDTVPSLILTGRTRNFGYRVAAAGNINGDSYDDILIGEMEPSGDTVFVYHGSSTGIHAVPDAILPSVMDGSGSYGISIAGAGDINNDNFDDIIVGDYMASSGQQYEGLAYVYFGRAAGINPVPGASIQSNKINGTLGWCVAGAGDVNGDNYDDLVIGAPDYAMGQLDEGAAFVFHGAAFNAGRVANPVLDSSSLLSASSTALTSSSVSLKAFPNPAIDNLSVQFNGLDANSNTYIQVLNIQGTLVETIQLGKVESGNQQINLGKLIPGLYFVIIQNGSHTFKEKIIKQ